MIRTDRIKVGRARLIKVLSKHKVATFRTLEQKISDAGPFDQRVDPHLLTKARSELQDDGKIIPLSRKIPWFRLSGTSEDEVQQRLSQLEPIQNAMTEGDFSKRLGQTLEIAVFRALSTQQKLIFVGHYLDLAEHDDSELYQKEEPPSGLSGKFLINKKKFDFVVVAGSAGIAGIEVKNVREWLYPDRDEVKELLFKSCAVDAVPVLIGRRIPYVTFRLLNACGVIIHQTYNQWFPSADVQLADRAKHKDLLGYHDIRVGNHPDARLIKFIHVNLPTLIGKARSKFNDFKDLAQAFATNQMAYAEFSARVRRRTDGTNEETDEETDFTVDDQ